MADIAELRTWMKPMLGFGPGPYKGYTALKLYWVWKKLGRKLTELQMLHERGGLPDKATDAPICQDLIETVGDLGKLLESRNTPSQRNRRPIHRPPGWRLHRLATFVYSPKTFDRVFVQTLRDMQDEHSEALSQGRLLKARWVVLRGYWSFWSTAAAQLPVSAAKKLYEIWKIGH
ncbi:MAG TPA: hypothetical protein VM325_13740 [Alphaproteobacteria bacterium]|nr:hypothetical protein [Alphaproteobacteria bacterium]